MRLLRTPSSPVPGLAAPWRRLLRKHRRLLAGALAAIAVLVAVSGLRPAAPVTEPVLVAVRDLAPGTRPTASDVEVRRWPVGVAPAGALTDSGQLQGRPLVGALAAGDPLSPTRFLSPALMTAYGQGLVATPVRLADAGAAALLQEGDVVDVLAATPAAAGTGTTQVATVVAGSVRVVLAGAAGSSGDSLSGGSSGDGSLIVLATTPTAAAALAGAAVTSRLSVVVRAQ